MRPEYEFGGTVANPHGRVKGEEASELKGQALTQGASSHLNECASRDIEEAAITILSDEAFDQLRATLEAPTPESTKELLERRPAWQ